MAKTHEYPVIWLQAATCTGCPVSVLNSVSPAIKHLLIDEILPGKHVNLRFHTTVMAGAGEPVIGVMEDTWKRNKGEYILVAEGAIPTRGAGRYGSLGERNGAAVSLAQRMAELGADALVVIALGTCAAYGGVAAAAPNFPQSISVPEFFRSKGINTPLINVPGCPPHPDWFIGTMTSLLLMGLPDPEQLDEFGRPKAFYGKLIHENCQRRGYYDENKFAAKLGDEGCLYELGCKGPVTHADCPIRLWNGGVNWCVGCGGMCIGCTSPGFPDMVSPIYQKAPDVRLPNIAARGK
ncbi:MAG: hydrogenase small subunit [Syntrophobacteraceae bacterium]|jgi:hydrogenase small subunit